MKIHKIQGDLNTEITSKIKDYCSIDCEMQGLKPDRDKLSIVSLTGDDENVYVVLCNIKFDKEVLNNINLNKLINLKVTNIEKKFISKYSKVYNLIK